MFQTRDPIRDAVTNGADWLDVVYPEWVEHINLDEFELKCPNTCILGQIFNTFYFFVPRMRSSDSYSLKFGWVIEHGFMMDSSHNWEWVEGEWRDTLQDAWIAEIITRKYKGDS